MATINGARALGLSDDIGSIELGKYADVICVSLASIGQQPILDPVSQLVYSVGREHVTDVWVAGEHLVAQNKLLRMDEQEIALVAAGWAGRITHT
jgi:5-methylthioadenosine/S-adenosylhomocysteine deaminase